MKWLHLDARMHKETAEHRLLYGPKNKKDSRKFASNSTIMDLYVIPVFCGQSARNTKFLVFGECSISYYAMLILKQLVCKQSSCKNHLNKPLNLIRNGKFSETDEKE